MSKHIRFVVAFSSVVVLAGQQPSTKLSVAQRSAIEKAVTESHAEVLRFAERLDLDKAMSSMLENDKGAFIKDGELLLTRQEVHEVFKRAYEGLDKQSIEVGRQNVIVLSPDAAILIGEGTSTATTKDGQTFGSRWAETVVYVRVNEEWKVLHAHQSLPARR